MSSGGSKLNPYAAEYVPLAKRGENAGKPALVKSDSSSVAFMDSSSHENTMPLQPDEGHNVEYGQDGENQADDGQQIEIDVAYLQTQFPTISEQSLLDVYCVNQYDLDAAHDMLSQLESLPDSLDIGDVSEPHTLPEFANLKLKEVAAASGTASVSAQPQPQDSK